MERRSILCWCRPDRFEADFSTLAEGFELRQAERPEALLEAAEAPEVGALLYDPEYRPLGGRDLLRELRERRPALPVALNLCTNDSHCFALMRSYGVGASLPRATPLDALALRLFFEQLTGDGRSRPLSEQLPEARQGSHDPRSAGESQQLLDSLRGELRQNPFLGEHDLHLIFEEMINNALFHAFVDEAQRPCYGERSDEPFAEGDRVRFEWALSERALALGISDSRGSLAPGTVWDRLYRQTSMEGLFDTSGRGLFITHKLSSLVLIHLRPGAETTMQVFFTGLPEGPGRPISLRIAQERGPQG